MSYSSYSNSGYNNDEETIEDISYQQPVEPIETSSQTVSNVETIDLESIDGAATMGIGFIDAYECNLENPIEDNGLESLNALVEQVYNPGVKSHPTSGFYKDSKGNTVIDQGQNLNIDTNGNLLPQLPGIPCINRVFTPNYNDNLNDNSSGWDYVDYETKVDPDYTKMGDGVVPVLTIPCGPPKGYGNISHNPVSYQQTESWVKIMYHMDGRKWHHIKKNGEGLQEDIMYTDDWESGVAYTASNAGFMNRQCGIHTTVGGSNSWKSKDGGDVKYGKWRQKGSNGKNWDTPNNIVIGIGDSKSSDTTMDFGVVGVSGFIYPHRSDIDSPKGGNSYHQCSFKFNHLYGCYRWDSDDAELEQRADDAKEMVEYLQEIVEEIISGIEEDNTYSTSPGRTFAPYTDNFLTRLYDSGKLTEMGTKEFVHRDTLGVIMGIKTLCELIAYKLPENEGKREDEIVFPYSGELLTQMLEVHGKITAADLFSYIYTRVSGVPEEALRLIGQPLDLEAIVKFNKDEILPHAHLHRFIFWAFINKNARKISKVSFDEGDFVITLGDGIKITFAEFVHYFDWGWHSICENNGGVITGDTLVESDGRKFSRNQWCVDPDEWDLDPEYPVHILDPLPINGKIYLGDRSMYRDPDDDSVFDIERRFTPPVSTFGAPIFADPDEALRMTRIFEVETLKGVNKGILNSFNSYDKSWLENEATYEFKKGETQYMYEWINTPMTDEEGNKLKKKPALEFFFASKKDAPIQDWVKLITVQPGGRVTSKPAGSKANPSGNERRFMRVQAYCPNAVGNTSAAICKDYMNQLKYTNGKRNGAKKGTYKFDVVIIPAVKGNSDDTVQNEYSGPCYHAEENPGNLGYPQIKWKHEHWEQPLRNLKYTVGSGVNSILKNLTVGKYYEIRVPRDSVIASNHNGVFPELSAWWGKDKDCLTPKKAGALPVEQLYTPANFKISAGNHEPKIIKAQTPWLFFASTKTGRTIDQWCKRGESWVTVHEVEYTPIEGPSYYSEDQNDEYPGLMNIEDDKWMTPFNTLKIGGNNLKPGGLYTIRAKSNAVASYRIMFAMNQNALSPRQYGISNANMLKGNHYYDTGIILNKFDTATTHEFCAPSPYMILCAFDADDNVLYGGSRTRDNWSANGEPAGPDLDNPGFELTYKGNSSNTSGPVYWAMHDGQINLNEYNQYPPYMIQPGQIHFNNGYWFDPIDSTQVVYSDITGGRIVPGRNYRIQINEVGITPNNSFNGIVNGKYYVNWLINDDSVGFKDYLGDPTRNDQSRYNELYNTRIIVDEQITAGDNGGAIVKAQSDRFILGLSSVPDMASPNRVKQSEWPIKGAKGQITVEPVAIPEGPGYVATGGVSNQNPVGKIPFQDQTYTDNFNKPYNTFRGPVRVQKGGVYRFSWKTTKTHNYNITFNWVAEEAARGQNYFNNTYVSVDDAGRFVFLLNSNNSRDGVVVTALEDYLMFGVEDLDDPNITAADWGRDGREVEVDVELVSEPPGDEPQIIVGPAYFAEGYPDHMPPLYEQKFVEPVTYEFMFTDEQTDRVTRFQKGGKYRFELKDDAKCDVRIVFLRNGYAAEPKANGITNDNDLALSPIHINCGIDLIRGQGPVEIYSPGAAYLYGAFNCDPLEDGTARTLENWSEFGEPVGTEWDANTGGTGVGITDLTPPPNLKVQGPCYWANYQNNTININAQNPTLPEFEIGKGEINFYSMHWNEFNTIDGYTDEDGIFVGFIEGEYYNITINEVAGYEYRARYLLNWISDDNAADPSKVMPPEGFGATHREKYNINIGEGYTSAELQLQHGGTISVKARGTKLVIGMRSPTQGLTTDFEKFNELNWSPDGQPIDVTVAPDLSRLKGPAYLADGINTNAARGHINFNDPYWELPFNSFQANVPFIRNQNYRIRYRKDAATGQIIDSNDYSFYWLSADALSSKSDEYQRTLSVTESHRTTVELTRDFEDDGIVVKCKGDYLVFGASPHVPLAQFEWSSQGQPVELLIEQTNDPAYDDPDEVIEGPAYITDGDDPYKRPDIGNTYWHQPLTTSIQAGFEIVKGRTYRIDNDGATSDLRAFFLLDDRARNPLANGITKANMFDQYFADTGVEFIRNLNTPTVFIASSNELIFGAFNNDLANGEVRTIENWSERGEPANVLGAGPESGITITEHDEQYLKGAAYWADYANHPIGGELDANSPLDNGEINFFHPHWEEINCIENVTEGDLIQYPDGSYNTAGLEVGQTYKIKIHELTGYEFGGKFKINWLMDDLAKQPSYIRPGNNIRETYNRHYQAEDVLMDPSVEYTFVARSPRFSIGVVDVQTPIPAYVLNTIYNWNCKGFPVSWQIQKAAPIQGPAYLGDVDGDIDTLNSHWASPFNPFRQPGLVVQSNSKYIIRTEEIDGVKQYTGLDYHIYTVTADGMYLNGNNVASDDDYFKCVDENGTPVRILDRDVLGGGYAEFFTDGDDRKTYIIFAAFDPANPNQPITDWSPHGQPVNFKITLDSVVDTANKGPAYYGSATDENVLTDFTNPKWERIYHWNNSPQNAEVEGEAAPIQFERGGYYRVQVPYDQEINSDFVMYGATNPSSLLVGNMHFKGFYEYGKLTARDGYIDMKDIQYPEIIFCSSETPDQYTFDAWSPQGEPFQLEITDRTNDVPKDPQGDYIKGPAYYAGHNVLRPETQFLNPWWLGPLNLYPGIEEGKRYRVVADPDLKGDLTVCFAPDIDHLYPLNGTPDKNWSETDFDITDTHLSASKVGYFRALNNLMLFAQYNVPGYTDVTDWSPDGQPAKVHITEWTSPGTDEFGNEIQGPAYWADDSERAEPDWLNYWWDTPLNPLQPGRFVKDNRYTLTGADDMPAGVQYKIWYGDRNSRVPGPTTTFRTNDEYISRGQTVEIVALEENIYLGAINTGRDNITDWGFRGEPANVIVKDSGGSTAITGPGYYGSANENLTLTDFTDPHWERIYHWNNRPTTESEIDESTIIQRGLNYRFTPSRSGQTVLMEHDYDLYAARDDMALVPGENNSGNFIHLGTLRRSDQWLDIAEISHPDVVFCAINLGAQVELTDWSPQGEPVLIDVRQIEVPRDPNDGNRLVKGPAYFAESSGIQKPDFGNPHYMSPLNYFPGVVANTTYNVIAEGTWRGRLKIFFAKDKDALTVQSNNPNDFIDSGVSLAEGETVEVRASTEYMIFGWYDRPGASLQEWSRNGERAQVRLERVEVNQLSGPGYYAESNPENEPEWLNQYWDVPLNAFEPQRVVEGTEYILTALPEMPDGIQYKLWFSDTNRPQPTSRFVTNDVVINKESGQVGFTALGNYMYFGAFDTGRSDITEWSRRGEPVAVELRTVATEQIVGPGYYGSRNETNVLTDFTNPHWDAIWHWNESPQNNLQDNPNATHFERDRYYRITKTRETEFDYGIYGARRVDALMVGDVHNRSFEDYGLLTDRLQYVDIKEMQFTDVIFCTANDNKTQNLEDWNPSGQDVKVQVEELNIERTPDGEFIYGPAYWQPSRSTNPDFTDDHWITELNTISGLVKGRKYTLESPDTNIGSVQIIWVKSDAGRDPRTNSDQDFIFTKINLSPGESVTVDALTNHLILGCYNRPGKNTIRDWNRDGERYEIIATEYTFDEDVEGPLYWANNATNTVDFRNVHWDKPMRHVPRNKFSKGLYYRIKKGDNQVQNGDIHFIWNDDPSSTNANSTTSDYVYSSEVLKEGQADVIVKAEGNYLFLGNSNLPGNHVAANDLTYWSPTGQPFDLQFFELDLEEGPMYWADENTTPANWTKGLTDWRDGYWDHPPNFLEGILNDRMYEVGLPFGDAAPFDYYIWETDLRDLSKNPKRDDFFLAGIIPKGSRDSINITFKMRNQFVSVRETGVLKTSWSPKGKPTDLQFTKIAAGRTGISYYANKKDKVGAPNLMDDKQEREIDWNNPKWHSVDTNFHTDGPASGFNTNREYKITLQSNNPKYVYSIWTLGRGENSDRPGGNKNTGIRRPQGNISLNKKKVNITKSTKIFPVGNSLMLAAWDFSGETKQEKRNRTLQNWSPGGEPVRLKIKATNDTAIEIPWGPIMGAITEILNDIIALLSLIFGLIGKLKPDQYFVNFEKKVGYDEVTMLDDYKDGQVHSGKSDYPYATIGSPLFINRVADKEGRFVIRFASLRFNGYMVNTSNHKGATTGTGESHWFMNLGFQNFAATHSLSIFNMGNLQDKVRIIPFQYRKDKGPDYHTRKQVPLKEGVYVPPRRLVTKRDSVKEQGHWRESDRWFNISAAYAMRVPKAQDFYTTNYAWGTDGLYGGTQWKTRKEGFMETHNSSAKSSKQYVSVAPVNDDGDGFVGGATHIENIFNDKGTIMWMKSGKTSYGSHRSAHYVIGIEGPERKDYKDEGGLFKWPVSSDVSDNLSPTDPFYLGCQIDISATDINTPGSIGDWQIAYWRIHVGGLFNDDTNKHLLRWGTYGDVTKKRIYKWGREIDCYPTYDTKYLLRGTTKKDQGSNDMFGQINKTPRTLKLVGSTKFYPNTEVVTAITFGVSKGIWDSKTYTYSFKLKNLKPLSYTNKPNLILDKSIYQSLYP